MPLGPGLCALLELVALCFALGLLSRVWFARWLAGGLLEPAGHHFPRFYQLFRTPGNMVHEGGHAVGYLLAGYRVSEIRFCFNDPAGRGYVKASGPYAPWGTQLLARLVASPAPLLAGAFAVQLAAWALEVPHAVAAAFRPGIHWWPELSRIELGWEALWGMIHTPWGPLQLALFLLLALSVGVELSPSGHDLKSLAWPAALLAAALLAIELAAREWPSVRAPLHWIDVHVAMAFEWLCGPLWWALIALIGVGVLLSPLRILMGMVRR